MPTRQITITDEVGLHARPAARFVKLANSFAADVTVSKGERTANAKSLVEILQLEAGQGSTVVIDTQGDDADQALEALAAQLEGSTV